MKQIQYIILTLLLLSSAIVQAATATYNMGNKDGSNGEQVVDGEMLFYDAGGPSGPSGGFMTGFVRFKAKNAGEPLTIEFLGNVEFNNADSHLYIYDGESGYPATGGWKKPVPPGYKADLQNGNTFSYTSTNGVIEVLFYAPSSSPKENGNGWTARLSTAPPKDMEWKGISASQEFEAFCFPGVSESPILRVDITTEGSLNPLSLSRIDFALQGSFTAQDISNIRCYYNQIPTSPAGARQVGTAYDTTTGTLSFTDNVELGNGANHFWLVADINAEATPGHTIDATAIQAVVNNIERLSSPLSPDGNRVISNTAFMQSGNSEYSIGDVPLELYDDGGPSAPYTQNFTGTAVFKPAKDGQKVGVKFTYLDFFNTSSSISVGNNDVIRIYNGTTASAENLLATVIQNSDTVNVYSTAANGALTITFTSKTAYPAQGFAAKVSLFTPQPMTYRNLVSKSVAPENLSANATASFLTFDLQTEFTEPAAEVSDFKFNIAQSENCVTSAALYHIGNTGSAVKIADAEVVDATLTFHPSETFALGQSHNHFELRLTTGQQATNGATINVSAKSVTVNGTEHFPSEVVTATSVILNKALSTVGTKEYAIYGPRQFSNTPSDYSYYGYDAPIGEQITTFLPGKQGAVVEIDFTKLSIAFPSYSYGSDPSFKIINGASTTGSVMYEVNRDNRNANCPTTIFRSTDPSGAITIVFDPSEQRGTSISNGFTANVNLYEYKDMELKSIDGFQAPAIDVTPGSTNNPIAGLKIITEGCTNPLTLNKLQINLKNCAPLVKVANLYASNNETFNINEATLIGTDTIATSATSAIFNCEYILPERTSYLHLTYDVADSFASNIPVDAAFGEILINNNKATINNPDPEGESLTKNIYYFSGDANVPIQSSLMFYDDGGPDGKYTNTHKGTLTFRPAQEGDVVKFRFISFYTNVSDDFIIYNGTGTEGKKIATYYSSKTNLPDIVSTADDGALTVVFNPSKNLTNDGWAIEVSSFTPQPLSVDTIVVSAVTPTKILRGSQNNTMLHAVVTITGDKGNINVSEIDFDALSSTKEAISRAVVYCTNTNEAFSPDEIYAIDSTGNMTFHSNYNIKLPGTYHFWLAYDVTSDATSNARFAAKMKSIAIDGTSYPYNGRLEAECYLSRGMHGTYVIGKSEAADFASFETALIALQTQGMEAPVVMEVEDGEYTEHVLLNAVAGNSAINTFTLRSKSRKQEAVTVNFETYLGGSDAQSYHGVLTLNGINHAIIEDMTFTTNNEKMEAVVYVKGYSRFDTIRNCHIHTVTRTNAQEDVNLIKMAAINEANRNNDFFNVEGCLLEGGYIGLNISGTQYVALPSERGARVIGNTLRNQGLKAIFLSTELDAEIRNNVIEHDGNEMTNSFNAIDVYRSAGSIDISGNIINIKDGTSNSTVCGIYVRGTVLQQAQHRYYNNDITIEGKGKTSIYAFQLNESTTGLQTVEIQHNTLCIKGEGADYSSALFLNTYFGEGSILRNNILLCEMPGYAIRIKKLADTEGAVFANNALYTTGSKIANTITPSSDYDFEEFNTTIGEIGAINEQPQFLTPSIHELNSAGNFNAGIPVEYITTDLPGRPRHNVTPTIGAYEYMDQTVAPVITDGYPIIDAVGYNSATIRISSNLAAKAYISLLDTLQSAPDVQDVLASNRMVELRAMKEGKIDIPGLRPNTTYRAYIVLQSFGGTPSEVICSSPFTTTYQPIIVSTFEEVETGAEDFMSGTAQFIGFKVIEESGAPGKAPAAKVAVTTPNQPASVILTNAFNLQLNGFFMRNDATVSVSALDAEGNTTNSKEIAPSGWQYINLRDMGLVSSVKFTSTDAVYIDDFSGEPLSLNAAIASTVPSTANEGETLRLKADVSGGVPPYSFVWTDAAGNLLANTAEDNTTLRHSTMLSLKVTDSWNNLVTDRLAVRIAGNLYAATFDDLVLAPESSRAGEEDGINTFFSGSWELPNYYMADWASWAWFGYSNSTATEFNNMITDQYNNVVGGGFRSSNYGVVFADSYWGACAATLSNSAEGNIVPGVYITNSAWVKDAILNGDGMSTVSGGFAKGDYLLLTLKGTRADNSTVEKQIYLADYRDENEVEHYYLRNWQWFDLSDMGKLKKINFSMTSSKSNSYGMTTPAYFMIDNLGGTLLRDTLPVQTVQLHGYGSNPARLSLAQLLEIDPTQGSVTYLIPNAPAGCVLTDNGDVRIMGELGSNLMLNADVRQQGHTRHLAIPIHIDTTVGVDTPTGNTVKVWPVPARETINVDIDLQDYNVEIFSLNGQLVSKTEHCSDHTTVLVDYLTPGNYILRVTHPQLTYTRKIVVSK